MSVLVLPRATSMSMPSERGVSSAATPAEDRDGAF